LTTKPEISADSAKGAPSLAPRSLCVVVADDDRDAVLTLMMVLRDEGHETHGAYTAQQTLDAVRKFEPDAMVLDIALGRSSGYDVAQKIRDRHGDERPLIIGVSGIYKKGSDKILAELSGFNHYLVKPYEPREVLKLLAPLRDAAPLDFKETHRDDAHRGAVVRAAALVGGARQLADRLGVDMSDMTRWIAGKNRPPIDVLFRVIDILLAELEKPRVEPAPGELGGLPKTPDATS
jgi:CheY-like chemotaxis protein